jgi:hypothetical protein
MARAIVVGLESNWGELPMTTRAPCVQHGARQCEPVPRAAPWRVCPVVTSTGDRCMGR